MKWKHLYLVCQLMEATTKIWKKWIQLLDDIYDVNQHKMVTRFLDMCISKSFTSACIFSSIDLVMSKYQIPWSNCILLVVDNTSISVGKHKSFIVEIITQNDNVILMDCPWHIAHNTARKSTKAFCDHFEIEELLVDIYFHFNYSSKRKIC